MKRKFGLIKKYLKKYKWVALSLFVNDKKFLSNKYKKVFGYEMDFDNPVTLNEKMQWMKLYARRDEYITFADKLLVRDFVSEKIGEQFLIPIFSVLENSSEITMDMLPNEPFIVKTNHDSSGGIIVRNKSDVKLQEIKDFCDFNLSNNHYHISREKHYKDLDRKILIEKLLLDRNGKIPNDYKINCFDGKAEFIYCAIDREGKNYRKIYDKSWNPLGFKWGNKSDFDKKFNGPDIDKPLNLDLMIKCAEELSKGFPYLRIDLYNVDGNIYLGEITIFHGGGFDVIEPRSFDVMYGNKVNLN